MVFILPGEYSPGNKLQVCKLQAVSYTHLKVDGLPYEILEKALEQAKQGRLHIMNIIKETLPEPRPELKPHAPRMVKMCIRDRF